MKATDQIERINKRRMRAMSLTAQIMELVGKYIPYDPDRDLTRDLHYELLDALERHGAEIVSDFDRQEFGLPPRGPDGWTMEEIIALEQRRLEMLTRPIQFVVPGPLIDPTAQAKATGTFWAEPCDDPGQASSDPSR